MKYVNKFSGREEKKYLQPLSEEEKYEAFNEMIADSRHIVFFGGAGVSTESGVPDFRSKDGLYNQHDVRFDAYTPEYLLSNDCLYAHSDVFYEFYRQKMNAEGIEPNAAHKKLAEMMLKGKLDCVITQNIDGLHQKAMDEMAPDAATAEKLNRKIYEIHGSTLRNYCDKCGKKYPADYIFKSEERVPHCDCGGMIRPNVTLYGEMLPAEAWRNAESACEQADLMIIGGTSLSVYPAANLIDYFRGKYLVLINRDATSRGVSADLTFHDSIGKVLSQVTV